MATPDFRKYRIEADTHADRRGVPDPPGFDAALAREQSAGEGRGGSKRSLAAAGSSLPVAVPLARRQEALFAQASAPLKQVGMLAFMMWMSGSQLHLFSIMATLSGLYQPLQAILKSKEAFPADPKGQLDTLTPRLLYCLIHGAGVAFAVYRINGMGLLPTTLSDWVAAMHAPSVREHAVHGLLGN